MAAESDRLALWQAGVDSLDPLDCRVPGLLCRGRAYGEPGHWPGVHAGMRAFLARWGEQAVALGYTTEALSGVHRIVGALRADATGALVTVFPMTVEAIDAATITLARSATRQTFRGIANPAESVPIWDYER